MAGAEQGIPSPAPARPRPTALRLVPRRLTVCPVLTQQFLFPPTRAEGGWIHSQTIFCSNHLPPLAQCVVDPPPCQQRIFGIFPCPGKEGGGGRIQPPFLSSLRYIPKSGGTYGLRTSFHHHNRRIPGIWREEEKINRRCELNVWQTCTNNGILMVSQSSVFLTKSHLFLHLAHSVQLSRK